MKGPTMNQQQKLAEMEAQTPTTEQPPHEAENPLVAAWNKATEAQRTKFALEYATEIDQCQ